MVAAVEGDEVAVAAFLDRRIRFDQIHALNVETLTTVPSSKPDSLAALLELDARARSSAQQHAARMAA